MEAVIPMVTLPIFYITITTQESIIIDITINSDEKSAPDLT